MKTLSPLSRRNFLGGLATVGTSLILSRSQFGVQTPAAQANRINVHHHLTAPAYVKFLTENKVRDFPNKTVAEGLEDMEKTGIATAITSIIGPGIWFGDIAATRRLARECNDFAAKLVVDYPGRFGMFASLPLPDIDSSLREIEYALDTLKADGIYLFTNFGKTPLYGDKYLGDPMLAPIYQELNRRRAVVYTHPKDNLCCRDIVPGVEARPSNMGPIRHVQSQACCTAALLQNIRTSLSSFRTAGERCRIWPEDFSEKAPPIFRTVAA
jgi:hypothetical protein